MPAATASSPCGSARSEEVAPRLSTSSEEVAPRPSMCSERVAPLPSICSKGVAPRPSTLRSWQLAPPEPSTPERVVKERQRFRCSCGVLQWALVGLICMFLAGIAGVSLQFNGANGKDGVVATRITACQLQMLGGEPALLTKPWEPENTQWLLGIVTVFTFALRKHAIPFMVRRFYKDLPMTKQVKIANYMLELLGTSLALICTSAAGLWGLLFDPAAYGTLPTVDQAYRIATGLQLLLACLIPMYIMELAFDDQMRSGLVLHHWVSIVLVLWGALTVYEVGLDTRMVRALFALSLYMSTEQNVFLEMLAYHQKVYWPICYTLSAWYYLLSRIAIMVLSLWTWVDCFDAVFRDGKHNSALVYAFWLFVPPANAILNATQLTTVSSLFGIATTVRKRVNRREEEERSMARVLTANQQADEAAYASSKSEMDSLRFRSKLYDVFSQIDIDDSGFITLHAWKVYVKSLDLDLVLPNWAITRLFSSMGTEGIEKVDFLVFERFFLGFAAPSVVEFKLVLMGALIKTMLTAEIESSYRAVLMHKYQAVLDNIQCRRGCALGSEWTLLPRLEMSTMDDDLHKSMCKSWTEPGGGLSKAFDFSLMALP